MLTRAFSLSNRLVQRARTRGTIGATRRLAMAVEDGGSFLSSNGKKETTKSSHRKMPITVLSGFLGAGKVCNVLVYPKNHEQIKLLI
jgi:hypothetical protein